MSWTQNPWKQIGEQYPIPVSVSYPTAFDVSKVYTVWKLTHGIVNGYPYPSVYPNTFDINRVYTTWKIYNTVAEGYPSPGTIDPIKIGAFAYLTNLTSITIPSSVKSIGRYAFYKTGLQSVTLANDCTYYSTSFPPECDINGGQKLY